jgi:hypothetical protein
MLNRFLIACLAALLLLGQLGAQTHALRHESERASAPEAAPKPPAHAREVCADCLAYAVFCAALTPPGLGVATGFFFPVPQRAAIPTAFVAAPAHFRSRAPPPANPLPA